MYKVDLPLDLREQAIINARRQREEERKLRIFNSKLRQIGIDKQALQEQVKEREQQVLTEKQRNLTYSQDAIRNEKIACLLQQKQEQSEKEIKENINKFRLNHQKIESRREFDLYDPDRLKKDKPARVSDNDPRCGISSIQKFNGEDLNNQSRIKYQRKQMQTWLETQIEENNRATSARKEADRLCDLKRRELDERTCELAAAEEQCCKAINTAVQRYNCLLKAEADERKNLKMKQEQDDNMTEIYNSIYSDLLSENPAQAISAFGSHRVIPDRYKGMSAEQKNKIFETQKTQIDGKKQELDEEKVRDAEWDRQRVTAAKLSMLLERELERSAKEIQRNISKYNLNRAIDQKSYQQYLDKELYTNRPTAAYFTQFNTTTR